LHTFNIVTQNGYIKKYTPKWRALIATAGSGTPLRTPKIREQETAVVFLKW
jgi:hypothetical protein